MTREELHAKYGNTKVGVVPAECVTVNGWVPVFNIESVNLPPLTYLYRCDAELDESYRQPIAYTLFLNNKLEYFVTQRKAGDSRLTGRLSLGIGGHIEDGETLWDSYKREIREEVVSEDYGTPYVVALLASDATPVDKVHLGIIILSLVRNANGFAVKETNKLEGWWMTQQDIVKNYDKFESWSQIVIDKMIRIGEMPDEDTCA